jgi:hypothetical protein
MVILQAIEQGKPVPAEVLKDVTDAEARALLAEMKKRAAAAFCTDKQPWQMTRQEFNETYWSHAESPDHALYGNPEIR